MKELPTFKDEDEEIVCGPRDSAQRVGGHLGIDRKGPGGEMTKETPSRCVVLFCVPPPACEPSPVARAFPL